MSNTIKKNKFDIVRKIELKDLISHLLRRAHFAAEAQFTKSIGEQSGLTSRQLAVLVCVEQSPGMTQKILAEMISLDENSTSNLVSRMLSKKYITRKKLPDDGRSNSLFISPQGKKISRRATSHNQAYQQNITERLTISEKEELSRLLRKMLDI
jgi:DNA-binding MarR family transcriptional regulator